MPDVRIDTSALNRLARDLKTAGQRVDPTFRRALSGVGEIIAADARERAAAFSSRIPGSIRVRRRGFTVAVAAGGARAPHAAPFENQGATGSFRHPVFGNVDTWVSQTAHPFLHPAQESRQDDASRAVIGAVDGMLRRIGL